MKKFLMGNEAFAHAALEAGVNVVAGYPGTPSSELVETVAKLHAAGSAEGVYVEWSTNEKAALELLAGASYCGARTLYTCKQMGLNVASDPLMCVNYVGIKGGMVLFVADDPGPISSQTEQDTRRFAAFAKVPVLDPSTPEEGFAMMKEAFELSEKYKTPVIIRPTTRICHASTFFEIEEHTCARALPEEGFEHGPQWVIFPSRAYAAHGEINERLPRIAFDFAYDENLRVFNQGKTFGSAGFPSTGIVASGVSAAYTLEALQILEEQAQAKGIDFPACRFMQMGTPYPFPEHVAHAFTHGLEKLIVFEELDHVLEEEFLKYAGKHHMPYDVYGRLTGNAPTRGENSVEAIMQSLADFLDVKECLPTGSAISLDSEEKDELPVRSPVLCAGCPHRGSFYAIKRALGKKDAVLCGDIGCYTLGNAFPLNAVDTCLCMGAGITMAQGFAVASPETACLAFVGDSTFFASGMTGVSNAVYNGHNITVAVLDNATTAMTGSQPHPGTGVTLMGPKNEPISIEAVLASMGVACIKTADPLNLEESIAAAQEAIDFEGPSAIIFQQPCIQLKKPNPAVHIDVTSCTGCKRCITEIGCPGIGFSLEATGPKSASRGQAVINPSLCNGCGLCMSLCPSKSIVSGQK